MKRSEIQTDKFEFLLNKLNSEGELVAFHENYTFLDFYNEYYSDKTVKSAMTNFKKIMKEISLSENIPIMKGKPQPVDKAVFGINVIWTLMSKI